MDDQSIYPGYPPWLPKMLLARRTGPQPNLERGRMKTLQRAMEQALHGMPQQVLSELMTQKLAAQRVKLSARERKLLDKHVLEGGKDTLRFRRWQWWDHPQIKLDLPHKTR